MPFIYANTLLIVVDYGEDLSDACLSVEGGGGGGLAKASFCPC